MSEVLSDTLKNLGLSDEQIGRLTALQEAGRNIDFVYHHTDDGHDPQHTADQFDDFRNRLAAFSAEGVVPQQFAAALWDHLAPRFVGWRPGFIEDVEVPNLGAALAYLDQAIDIKLGRHIPSEVREVSQAVRTRFDNLAFAYEAGAWRDERTSGEVRDDLAFLASLDEKIRNVLYSGAREVDLRKTIEELGLLRGVERRHVSDTVFEARGYEAQLNMVSDVLDRLGAVGVQVRAGVSFGAPQERIAQARANEWAAGPSMARGRGENQIARRPASDADRFWRSVAQSASVLPGGSRSESRGQNTRRGRAI